MGERTEWPKATADLFTDAAGIAAYIDDVPSPSSTDAEATYRKELAELQADPSPTARRLLARTLADQRSAITAWLDALVHLGVARWTEVKNDGCVIYRRLVIEGPREDVGPQD